VANPQLNPPCPGWRRDLPGPNDSPEGASSRESAPNYVDDIYLELSRRSSMTRGILILFVPLSICFMVWQMAIFLQFDWYYYGS